MRRQTDWAGWMTLLAMPLLLCLLFGDLYRGRGDSLLVLTGTAGILLWYTYETYQVRRTTKESNTFVALTTIQQGLSDQAPYHARGLLHSEFDKRFMEVVAEIGELKSYMKNDQISPDLLLSNGTWRRDEKTLRLLNSKLGKGSLDPQNQAGHSALDIVEKTLLSLDAIALPASLGIEAAREAMKAYRPIFEKTARHIVPFVAVQMRLRADRLYKWHYLCVLRELAVENYLQQEQDGENVASLLKRLLEIVPTEI